ncbi:MAG: LolA family protein [Candidatus Sumerlaeia bacterium]
MRNIYRYCFMILLGLALGLMPNPRVSAADAMEFGGSAIEDDNSATDLGPKRMETPDTAVDELYEDNRPIETPSATPTPETDSFEERELGDLPPFSKDYGTSMTVLSQAEAREFLNEMSSTLRTIRALQVEFVQERYLVTFSDSLRSRGYCYFETPRKIRWEITSPYYSLLILNGAEVAKFDSKDGELRKMRLGGEDILRNVLDEIMNWMRGDFDDAWTKYNFEVARGTALHRLRMQPQLGTIEDMIQAIELYIDSENKRVRRVRIIEAEEEGEIIIRFTDDKINPNLNDRLFDTENPIRRGPEL